MRKLLICFFFITPVFLALLFINTAFLQGNPGFKVDKTQKGLLVSRVYSPDNPVKENDLIVKANGLSYHEMLGALVIRPSQGAGGALHVLRDGAELALPLETVPYTTISLLSLIWPRLLLMAVFLTLGVVVIYKVPPDKVSQLFFLMLCGFSTSLSTTIPSVIAFLSPRMYSFSFLTHAVSNWVSFGLWLHFALRFPEERDAVRDRWWIPWLIYLLPAVTTLGGAFWAAGMTPEFFGWVQRLRNLYLPVIIIGVFVKHVVDYRKIQTQQERNRIKLPLFAYWLSFAPYLFFYLLPNLLLDVPLISFRIVVFAFFILPLAYYAGILRYKLFNVDHIISRTITYFFTFIALSIIYSIFFAVLKRWVFGDAVLSKELFLIFLILVNILFHPVIVRLDYLVRRLLFRNNAISIKAMHDFSDRITATLALPRIIEIVTLELPPTIGIKSTAIMTFERNRSRLFPEHLRFGTSPWPRSRMAELFQDVAVSHFNVFQVVRDIKLEEEFREVTKEGFVLILPLRTPQSLSGLLFLGPKLSGGLFSEADILLLGSFANQAAIALENAIHYESLVEGKRQLESMFDQKVQAEKMAAIGEMTSLLAHELKNPLSIIHSSAQYMAKGEQSGPIRREMLDYILKEVDHLNLSINSILNLARQKPPEFLRVDLEKEIRHLINQWRHSRDHHQDVSIDVDVPKPLPHPYVDFHQMAQVFLNLVRNSEEMMPRGGEISLRMVEDDSHIQIRIVDSGPGIPEENLPHLFENFFTTKKQGLGLGLAACRQIVQAHNGEIQLTNRKEANQTGAVAEIRLPVKPLANIGFGNTDNLATGA